MNTGKHKVVLTEIEHQSKACYGIGFPYNYQLKEIVKSIDHVRWSAIKKTFYVTKEKLSLHNLYTSLNEKGVFVDYSRVKSGKRSGSAKRSKWAARKISDGNKAVLKAFVSYLRGLRLSENTIKVYFTFVADFVEFIDEKPLDGLTAIDVRLFVERQVEHKHYAISTHRQLVSALKHFGTFLPDSKIVVEDLIRPSKSRYLPTVLSKEEVIDLLRATRNLKHRAVLALLYSAGLRIGEVLNLKLEDIDIDRRQLFIKNAKGRKDRVVIMAESFIPLYKNYYLTYKPATYFIENPNGGVYSPESIRKFIKISSNRAGIKKRVTPHTLRHSYATHLIENGVGLRHVQDLLGHSKPETTMIYTHVAKKDLLKIQSPLDTAFIALTSGDKKHQKVRLSQNYNG
jgi:integrase/recombinase XerD